MMYTRIIHRLNCEDSLSKNIYHKNKKNILEQTSKEIEKIIKDKNISNGNYEDSVNYEVNHLVRSIGRVAVIGKLYRTIYYPNDGYINKSDDRDNPFFIIDKNLVHGVDLPQNHNHSLKMILLGGWC